MTNFAPGDSEYDSAWERFSLCFTQHRAWGEVKSASYEPKFVLTGGVPFALHIRKLPLIGGRYGYSPRAFTQSTMKDAPSLAEIAREICAEYKLSHIVIEPNVELHDDERLSSFKASEFAISEETIQPRRSRLIDLVKPDEELLSEMAKDVRRRIKRGEEEGYSFEERSDAAGLDEFYRGLSEVAARARFGIQQKGYFKKILQSFPHGMARIYLTRDAKGTLLYAAFVINDSEAFRRIYGGPTIAGRQSDGAQFTAWRAIRAAKELGAKTMDLWGVAPYDEKDYVDNHPLSGTSRFKASLGGRNATYWPGLIWVKSKSRFKCYQAMVGAQRRLKRLKRVVG